jgi:CRISPR-associated protein Csb2
MILGAESLGTGSQRAKIFVSGHEPDGKPVSEPHLAYLPLAFVGAPYADGHILGMALALPATASPDDEDLVYASLGARMAEDGSLTLDLGEKGRAILRFEDDPSAWALREDRWTAPSPCWASVTPIVMDRMAKAGKNDPWEWAAHEIARSCTLQGLPMPASIEISPVSFLEGSYPCYGGRTRPSSSFPRYEQKGGRNPWMFHAKLEFDEPVAGPLVLGAGRFRGYGLCAPMEASC